MGIIFQNGFGIGSIPEHVGTGWFFHEEDNTIPNQPPTTIGDIMFIRIPLTGGTPFNTYNPNPQNGYFISYNINHITDDGIDYNTQFHNLSINGGIITLTQNGDSISYSGTAASFLFNSNVNGHWTLFRSDNPGLTLLQSSNNPFIAATTISITFS
jgi:hypothetical protein